jgi:hypothetical protein
MALLVLLAVGCKSKGGPVEQVVEAWRGTGLTMSPFAAVDPHPYSAQTCSQGQVQGVDVVVCAYADEQASALAEQRQRSTLGAGSSTTALTLHQGKALVTLSDRAHADPNGRTIARLVTSLKSL